MSLSGGQGQSSHLSVVGAPGSMKTAGPAASQIGWRCESPRGPRTRASGGVSGSSAHGVVGAVAHSARRRSRLGARPAGDRRTRRDRCALPSGVAATSPRGGPRRGRMIVQVDSASPVPVFEQLRAQIERLIVSGQFAPGAKLPPIRHLAADLGLARGTVNKVHDALARTVSWPRPDVTALWCFRGCGARRRRRPSPWPRIVSSLPRASSVSTMPRPMPRSPRRWAGREVTQRAGGGGFPGGGLPMSRRSTYSVWLELRR